MRFFCLATVLLFVTVGCSQPRAITVRDTTTGREQVIRPVSATLYQGNSPDFAFVQLRQDPSLGWLLTVYDLSEVSGPMYPSAMFGQLVPDLGNPEGSYGRLVSGKPIPDDVHMRVSSKP